MLIEAESVNIGSAISQSSDIVVEEYDDKDQDQEQQQEKQQEI